MIAIHIRRSVVRAHWLSCLQLWMTALVTKLLSCLQMWMTALVTKLLSCLQMWMTALVTKLLSCLQMWMTALITKLVYLSKSTFLKTTFSGLGMGGGWLPPSTRIFHFTKTEADNVQMERKGNVQLASQSIPLWEPQTGRVLTGCKRSLLVQCRWKLHRDWAKRYSLRQSPAHNGSSVFCLNVTVSCILRSPTECLLSARCTLTSPSKTSPRVQCKGFIGGFLILNGRRICLPLKLLWFQGLLSLIHYYLFNFFFIFFVFFFRIDGERANKVKSNSQPH